MCWINTKESTLCLQRSSTPPSGESTVPIRIVMKVDQTIAVVNYYFEQA